MRISCFLACANALILMGVLIPIVIYAFGIPLADDRGQFFTASNALVLVVPACSLVGTTWNGCLALRERTLRGFWSRILFRVGIVVCLVELLVVFSLPLRGV